MQENKTLHIFRYFCLPLLFSQGLYQTKLKSKHYEQLSAGSHAHQAYMAPEALCKNDFTLATDVYSFGKQYDNMVTCIYVLPSVDRNVRNCVCCLVQTYPILVQPSLGHPKMYLVRAARAWILESALGLRVF